MKHFKIFSALSLMAGLVLASCNNDEPKTEVTTDSTANKNTTVVAPETPAGPTNIVLVRHKVANFSKWKAGYDSHDSVRLAAGLHNFVIGRGIEDSNTVLVALRADDMAKAKEFSADPKLKEVMQKGGVVGMPDKKFVSIQTLETSQAVLTRIIVTHKVKDWDAWKKVFDSHKQARLDAGLADRGVGYSVDDKNMVTVVFNVTDMAKAKAFFTSQDLKDKMAEAGVEGKPDIFMYNVVQTY